MRISHSALSFALLSLAVACGPGGAGAGDVASSHGAGASGGDSAGASGNGGGGRGGGTGSGGAGGGAPLPATCSGVPNAGFDPLAAWKGSGLKATVTVTTDADAGPGSLRAVMAAAPPGAVVGFAPALAGHTIALASTIELGESVTVDGGAAPGLTIDGQDKVGLFHGNTDSPRRWAFFGLRFVRGNAPDAGGAIATNGQSIDVEIGGCVFENNRAPEGGAVRVGYRLVSTTFIHDSRFSQNHGEAGSKGFSGGAISATATNLHVARCRFEANDGAPAGAVYAIHAQPLIEDAVFVNNVSHAGAGAFLSDGAGPGDNNNDTDVDGAVTLRRVRFEQNTGAGPNGGAVQAWGYPMDDITVEDAVFAHNVVENGDSGGAQGGALKVHIESKAGKDKRFRAARVAFVDNVSRSQGGGIWLDGNGRTELENTLFSGNVAESDRGGGVTFNQPTTTKVTVTNATFVGNKGGAACGAFWLNSPDNDVTMRNVIVAANEGKNSWEVQFGYAPKDGGGNIQWPAPSGGSVALGAARLVDPQIGDVMVVDGMLVRPIAPGSPARDTAVTPAPDRDERNAPRNGPPDVGAFEVGPGCGG